MLSSIKVSLVAAKIYLLSCMSVPTSDCSNKRGGDRAPNFIVRKSILLNIVRLTNIFRPNFIVRKYCQNTFSNNILTSLDLSENEYLSLPENPIFEQNSVSLKLSESDVDF